MGSREICIDKHRQTNFAVVVLVNFRLTMKGKLKVRVHVLLSLVEICLKPKVLTSSLSTGHDMRGRFAAEKERAVVVTAVAHECAS